MNLERFIEALGPVAVIRGAPVDVLDLAYDTRTVSSGTLFFCVRGASADGHTFAPAAAAAGPVALGVEHPPEVGLPHVCSAHGRAPMPQVQCVFSSAPTPPLDFCS